MSISELFEPNYYDLFCNDMHTRIPIQGITGATGPDGEGDKGPTGPTGPNFSEIAGPTGPDGVIGVTGTNIIDLLVTVTGPFAGTKFLNGSVSKINDIVTLNLRKFLTTSTRASSIRIDGIPAQYLPATGKNLIIIINDGEPHGIGTLESLLTIGILSPTTIEIFSSLQRHRFLEGAVVGFPQLSITYGTN